MVQSSIRFLGALLVLLFFGGPAFSQIPTCGRTLVVSAGATSITQFVAGQTGQIVVICGWELNAGAAAATFQLTTGTGTNCNTGTLNLTPAFSLGINGVLVSRSATAQISVPSGNALCYTITGTGPMNAIVYYMPLGG